MRERESPPSRPLDKEVADHGPATSGPKLYGRKCRRAILPAFDNDRLETLAAVSSAVSLAPKRTVLKRPSTAVPDDALDLQEVMDAEVGVLAPVP